MKVVFTAPARDNLKEIGDFIAEDSRKHARDYVRRLTVVAQQIGHMPRAYPVYERLAAYGVRRRTFENYLIFYRIEGNDVLILAFVHAARDPEGIVKRLIDPLGP